MPLNYMPKYPFRADHIHAIDTLFALCPPKVRAVSVYIAQIPEEQWQHGTFRGWSNNGSIELKGRLWLAVAGLPLHEFGHVPYQVLASPDQREEWGRFWDLHKKQLGTAYATTNPDEGYAESFVGTYRGAALKGYKPVSEAVKAAVRRIAE